MDDRDVELRNRTYRAFVDTGRAPTPAELGRVLGTDEDAIAAGWRRLHDAHALVLDDLGGIRMLNPFSAVPTEFRVLADGRWWYANCGWDAFGIGAALGVDSTIETECADCHEPLEVAVRDGRPDPDGLLWHVLVPAWAWWQDIGYT